jgi:acetylornithine deacetylase/succinyl-diaminopimelate desuccinylase-like protein
MIPDKQLLADLQEWLRVPSVSTGGRNAEDLPPAADWVCARIARAGGVADRVETSGNPLAVGRLSAAASVAPTVLIYGHYDVQGPGDPRDWRSPPFEPEIRDGRIYARGAADDKGNFLPLLHAACELHAAGELPVNVVALVEGEEEIASAAAIAWLRACAEEFDAALVFDGGMVDERTPAITVGMRGLVTLELEIRTAARAVHSGLFGGAALNALHALHSALSRVLPRDGALPAPLRAGVQPPTAGEAALWASLPGGGQTLAEAGARPADARAAAELHRRTLAEPSLDVTEIRGGEPRALIPASAHATISLRLAPGQDADEMAAALEQLLRSGAPPGAEVLARTTERSAPLLLGPDEPALALAADALARVVGSSTALVRAGGSIPIVAELAAQRVPTVVTGFCLPADAIHGPNESFRLEGLGLGDAAARAILRAFAGLPQPRR